MTLILVKDKLVPDFADGIVRGAVIGQLYTLFHTFGDLEMDAVLSPGQAIKIRRAAKLVDRVYNEMLKKNKLLAAKQLMTPLRGKRA